MLLGIPGVALTRVVDVLVYMETMYVRVGGGSWTK